MTRRENLIRLRQHWERGDEVLESRPAVLYLEATAVCNLDCPMCPITMHFPEYQYETKWFQIELLPKLAELLPLARRCFLSGGGEPFLHPRFFEIVAAVKSAGAEAIFNSNGTLLDEARALRLIELQADCVSFSVDGSSAETYQAIRRGADFEQVCANIARLSRLKQKRGSERPFLNLQFTLQDRNLNDLGGLVELARRLGIHHVVVEPLTPVFNFNSEYRAYYQAHAVPPAAAAPRLRQIQPEAERAGILLTSHYLDQEQPRTARPCVEPWLTFGVRVNGEVFACCGAPLLMGNLAEQSWQEIWNGEAYRNLRRGLARGEAPESCRLCWTEGRCNHFNEDLVFEDV